VEKFLKMNLGKEDDMYTKLETKYGLQIPKPPPSPVVQKAAAGGMVSI